MSDINANILRKVGDAHAFYFCRGLGNFTGQKANSLEEFLQTIQKIDVQSLEFHLLREDFEKWISLTLGDRQLAKDFAELRAHKVVDDNLRVYLSSIVSKRLKELRIASLEPKVKRQVRKKGGL